MLVYLTRVNSPIVHCILWLLEGASNWQEEANQIQGSRKMEDGSPRHGADNGDSPRGVQALMGLSPAW